MNSVQNSTNASIRRAETLPPPIEDAGNHRPPAVFPSPTTRGFPQQEYLVATYRNGRITQRRMTAEQVQTLDPAEVDFHLDTVFGRICIQPSQGERIEHFGSIPGIGQEVGLPLLQYLMFSPGRLRTDRELRRVPGLGNMAGNPLSQRLTKIRRAFRDCEELAWFIITARSPFRVGWNKLRSWRLVEALAGPASQHLIAG